MKSVVVEDRGVSRGSHVTHEFVVVDEPVTILVSVLDHLFNVFFAQFLAELLHDVSKLLPVNSAISILVKHGETLLELLLLLV